jgi:hypothetical protein
MPRAIAAALALLLVVNTAGPVAAQEPTPRRAVPAERVEGADKAAAAATAQSDDVAVDEAPVMLANRRVATLRGSFMGVPPERRAQRAEAALEEILGQRVAGKVSVKVEPQGHMILVDGQLAFFVVPADADRLHGQTLSQASEAARDALQRALDDTREGRRLQRLLADVGISVLATLVAAALLALTWRLRRWATGRLAALIAKSSQGIQVAGAQLLQTDRAVAAVRLVLKLVSWAVALMVTYQWLGFVLSQFPYTRPWGEGLTQFLLGIFVRLGSKALHAVPDLAVAVAIFLIARGVILMARPVFERVVASGNREGG